MNNRRITIWRGISSLSLKLRTDSVNITEKKALLRYGKTDPNSISQKFLGEMIRHAIRHAIMGISGTLSGTLSGTHNNSVNTPVNISLILQFNIQKLERLS